MLWNGYTGVVGGNGGALGCEGAMVLQWLQFARRAVMAGVMPGQKTDDSARAVIEVTSWWAEWRISSICCRSEGGMTMQSL